MENSAQSVQLKFREPKNENERIWNTASIRALSAISPLFEKGITLMHVWTTGTGYGYDVSCKGSEEANQGSKREKRSKKKKSVKFKMNFKLLIF